MLLNDPHIIRTLKGPKGTGYVIEETSSLPNPRRVVLWFREKSDFVKPPEERGFPFSPEVRDLESLDTRRAEAGAGSLGMARFPLFGGLFGGGDA